MPDVWISFLTLICLIATSRGENFGLVDSRIKITFKIVPPDKIALWRRGGLRLRDVRINPAGDDCLSPSTPSPPDYEFECRIENNASIYSLAFNSKMEDDTVSYLLDNTPDQPNFTYKPTNNTSDLTDCKNTSFTSSYSCKVNCNSIKPELSGTFKKQNQKDVVNISIIDGITVSSCGGDSVEFFESKIDLSLDKFKQQVSHQGEFTVKLSIGDVNFFFITTINDTTTTPSTLQTSPSSSSAASTQSSPLSSTSSPSQPPFSSPQPGPTTGDSSSTDTTPASTDPVSTDTTPAPTIPSPGTLTSTQTIITIVCCCVGIIILVVLVVCCVVVYIRRRGRCRKREPIKYNNNSVPRSDLRTRYPIKYNNSSVPRSDLHTGYPYHHSPSGEVSRYTNRGYKPWSIYEDGYRYSKPTDRHTQYNNVYNHPRPYRYQREELYMKPDRMYYQPHQYYYY